MTVKDYFVQPYDGAQWVAIEAPADPQLSLAAYLSLRRLNLVLYKQIPPDQRTRPFAHPELGEISIDWILHMLAGHDLHHLRHLQLIASQ